MTYLLKLVMGPARFIEISYEKHLVQCTFSVKNTIIRKI